jgi:PIN domain
MTREIILIDWENVQPDLVLIPFLQDFKTYIFVGPNQNKLPFLAAHAIQKLGTNAEYIKVYTSGKNALDLHIAFLIGRLSTEALNKKFHIISKDSDFDSLIKDLTAQKIKIHRWVDLQSVISIENQKKDQTTLDKAKDWLLSRGNSKPKTLNKLINSLLKTAFLNKLSNEEVKEIISDLQKENFVALKGSSVEYFFIEN